MRDIKMTWIKKGPTSGDAARGDETPGDVAEKGVEAEGRRPSPGCISRGRRAFVTSAAGPLCCHASPVCITAGRSNYGK